MKRIALVILMILIALPVLAANPESPANQGSKIKRKVKSREIKLKTEDQKTLYAVGLVMARQLASFNLTPSELRLVKLGLNDGVRGKKAKVDFVNYSKKSQEMGLARRDAHGKKLEAKAPDFIKEEASAEGAVKTKSGAIYIPRQAGEGASPTEADTVKLNFRSALIDNREMDSTYSRGVPEVAKMSEYLICLNEGIQMMKPGGKARLVCPPETALGKEGYGLIPPNATLVYEVELIEIMKEKK